MFKLQCDHETTIDSKPFALSDYLRVFVRTDAAFARNIDGLMAAVRIDNRPLEIESSDMRILRAALESPSSGYVLQPALAAVPFVRAVLDAKEE